MGGREGLSITTPFRLIAEVRNDACQGPGTEQTLNKQTNKQTVATKE